MASVDPPSRARADSFASSASVQSVSSLTRRPRIRGRSRALTGLTINTVRGKSLGPPLASELDVPVPMLSAAELLGPALPDASSSRDTSRPDRPPRSPLRASTSPTGTIFPQQPLAESPTSAGLEQVDDTRPARVVPADDETAAVERRRRKRGSSVPRDAYRLSFLSRASTPTSPLFSEHGYMHMQTLPAFPTLREARQRLRDSYLTQQSRESSSIYPLSSSTISGTESPPSPRSLADSLQDFHVTSVDPDEPSDEHRTFDADDVSYRLRLLVNNNYFLPPAHSKPSRADLAPVAATHPKKPSKGGGPGFFDLFRPKARSKPSSPNTPPENTLPILRATSDSTPSTSWTKRPHALSLPHSHLSTRPRVPTARIAVVRETMDDLAVAAKQAELDIKARGELTPEQDAQKDKVEAFDDVIDPTDAVDLPPPSADSPFAVQTSAAHGLGVDESVGAALLADRLPPGTPGVWSMNLDEETWRKALLHQAVGHSLTNTPAPSTKMLSPMHTPHISTSSRSPSHQTSSNVDSHFTSSGQSRHTPSPSPSTKRNLGQRIVIPEALEEVPESPRPDQLHSPMVRPRASTQSLQIPARQPNLSNSLNPPRAETPATPHTPLAPPPRKLGPASILKAEEDDSSRRSQSPFSYHSLRRATSSPVMHDLYEGGVFLQSSSASIAAPQFGDRASPSIPPRVVDIPPSPRHQPHESVTSGSHYSEDSGFEIREDIEDLGHGRASSSSASIRSRPSLSYSLPSPAQSAFQDGIEEGRVYDQSSYGSSNARVDERHGVQKATGIPRSRIRQGTRSPPPRTSSVARTTPLYPPPRSSSYSARTPTKRQPPSRSLASSPRPSLTSSDPGHSAYVSAVDLVSSPGNSRRPSPGPRRGANTRRPFTSPASSPYKHKPRLSQRERDLLQIPGPSALHGSTPAASPIEFFDEVQMAHATDDFESSDEEQYESSTTDYGTTAWATPTAIPSTPPRSPFMRLGNHSAPYVSSPTPSQASLTVPPGSLRHAPVGNVAPRQEYFKESKSDQSLSRAELAIQARSAGQHESEGDEESSSAQGHEPRSHRTQSMLRLDGLLLQHMEAERDTLNRIAKTAKAAMPSPS